MSSSFTGDNYRIFWVISHTVYYPHRHKNVNCAEKIVVLPAPTDNPHPAIGPKELLPPFCMRPSWERVMYTLRLPYAFFNIYYEPFASDDYLSTLRWIILWIINHFLTTVNTTFVLQLCKRSVTRPKLNRWIKAFTTFVSESSKT